MKTEVKTVIGTVPMDAAAVEADMKLRSINNLTDMMQEGMNVLWRITFSATNAPAHGKTPRSAVPTQLITEAKLLVERFKAEARRWQQAEDNDSQLRM